MGLGWDQYSMLLYLDHMEVFLDGMEIVSFDRNYIIWIYKFKTTLFEAMNEEIRMVEKNNT